MPFKASELLSVPFAAPPLPAYDNAEPDDATTAHKRIADLFAKGMPLPEGLDFTDRFIYYVGPVDPVRDEVVGPAGPTTATRIDKFADVMLEKTGLLGMIGKAERGPAYLVSKAIKSARIVAFGDLGMEAIYKFEVRDMPVTVAVDATGDSVHVSGPDMWRNWAVG